MNTEKVDEPPIARVTRHYDAAPERVFDAWLKPDMVDQWMFGPVVRDEEVVRISIDARVGGSFSFLVRRQGQEIDHIGEYLEIDRPRRLAFIWGIKGEPDASRVVIEITPKETGCELSLSHELHPDWAEFAPRAQESWAKMLEALAAALA